jgi:hypothetical protein
VGTHDVPSEGAKLFIDGTWRGPGAREYIQSTKKGSNMAVAKQQIRTDVIESIKQRT